MEISCRPSLRCSHWFGPAAEDGLFWSFVNCLDEIRRWSFSLRWVEVGQASVVMAISSPHRHDGQQAIQHCINQLKAKIPIWKKVRAREKSRVTPADSPIMTSHFWWQEVYDTLDCHWKENQECSWAAHSKHHPDTSSTENMWTWKQEMMDKTFNMFQCVWAPVTKKIIFCSQVKPLKCVGTTGHMMELKISCLPSRCK